MIPITLRSLLLLQACAAALTLSVALTGQYAFDLHPCNLCLWQRYPYAAIIVIAGLAGFRTSSTTYRKVAWGLCTLLFFVDAGIGTYHAGVELGWFPAPDACSNHSSGEETLEAMRAAILNAPLVSCSQAMISVLGLSMAAWNALAASAYGITSLLGIRYVRP